MTTASRSATGFARVLKIVLMVLWMAAVAGMTAGRVRAVEWVDVSGQIAALLFVFLLVLRLWPVRIAPVDFGRTGLGFGPVFTLILAGIAAVFLIGLVAHPALVAILVLTILSLWQMTVRRADLHPRIIMTGVMLAAFCMALSFAAGRLDGFQAFYLLCIPVLFSGGALLAKATGLATVHVATGALNDAFRGFALGCALGLPAALLNVSLGAHSGDAWVDRMWEPAVAIVPGIAEETWARLMMLTLFFALLQRASPDKPQRAVVTAVVLAAFVHALAHLPSGLVFSPAALQAGMSALLFGLPLGLIFVRHGFEAAVGYHTLIDFIRFAVALAAQGSSIGFGPS